MSVVSVEARSFILALFIRDDGERFLLGDNGYDFIDSQLHFVANTIENDEVEKQGADGVMLAGQVRRASVQTFDGYVGDATTPKDQVEEMRREFIAFFAKDHHFRVIYVDCNRNAWQRKGGYLVDAPEVKELWQIHPEYHVGLNFEDVNYYEYDENADGQEILANIMKVPISSDVEGGLVWDEDGAVSEDATVVYDGDTATASGKSISVSDAVEAPLSDFKLKGETSQQTYTGKNLVYTSGKTDGGITATYNAATGETTISGTAVRTYAICGAVADVLPAGTYTFSIQSAAPCAVGVATKASGGNRAGHPISTGATKTTFTISEDSEQYDIYLTSLTANTTYNFTFKAMLESGSSATSFEPYVGGVPAPNPDYPQAVKTVTGENVVKITGKNLLEMPIVSGSSNGITWTVQDDGSIILNGTSTAGVNIRANNVTMPAVEGETYTLSATGMGEAYNFGYKNSSSGANIFVVTSAEPTTTAVVTSTMLSQANRLDMYIQSGKTFNNQRVTLQLEKGSSASSFEPYQGQSYEVNLGKNLFDKDNASTFSGFMQASKSLEANASTKTIYIPCEGSTTYTVQKENTGTNNRFCIFTTSTIPAAGGTALNYVGTPTGADNNASYTITTDASAKYLCVFLVAGVTTPSVSDILATVQIEKGSQATSYAAYFEPIELCKIGTYQDSIYKSGGKWYVRKETGKANLATDRTSLGKIGSGTGFRGFTVSVNTGANVRTGDGSVVIPLFCNMLACTKRNKTYEIGSQNSISAGTASEYYKDFFFDPAPINDYSVADAETWLNNNPIIVYYPLATATDTEITNEALVAQLEAILSQGYTYAGTNNITTITPNEQGELEVGYYTRYEFEITAGGYVWEQGGSGGPTIIVNESISAVSPVWTVYGPALNPQLENATNGDAIEYVGMVSDGQTLVIDMGEQTAKLDGLNVISNVAGDFISLESGANTLLYSAGNDAPESEIGWSEIVG